MRWPTATRRRPFVIALFCLAVMRFVFGFVYRFGLFRSALRIENDLRNLMYERLTELSFDFWDRTQSGQVISRANTDIRSIQLLFAFGPLVAMQIVLFVFAVIVMLTVDVTLTLVAIAPLPFVYLVGVPASEPDLPAAVGGHGEAGRDGHDRRREHPGHPRREGLPPGGQPGPEPGPVDSPTPVGRHRRRRHPSSPLPRHGVAPRLGLALVLLVGGIQTIDGDPAGR